MKSSREFLFNLRATQRVLSKSNDCSVYEIIIPKYYKYCHLSQISAVTTLTLHSVCCPELHLIGYTSGVQGRLLLTDTVVL